MRCWCRARQACPFATSITSRPKSGARSSTAFRSPTPTKTRSSFGASTVTNLPPGLQRCIFAAVTCYAGCGEGHGAIAIDTPPPTFCPRCGGAARIDTAPGATKRQLPFWEAKHQPIAHRVYPERKPKLPRPPRAPRAPRSPRPTGPRTHFQPKQAAVLARLQSSPGQWVLAKELAEISGCTRLDRLLRVMCPGDDWRWRGLRRRRSPARTSSCSADLAG